jgi:tetraacyldisaccharide 4'-kinase
VKRVLSQWAEKFFYAPGPVEKVVSWLLWPLSLLYCFVMKKRYLTSETVDFHIRIVSVGNLTVGGSGKTPLVTALASKYADVAVILRGYGRQSSGLIVVSDGKDTLCDVKKSGDEAMIYAAKLPKAVVIVSEDRNIAIEKAKEMGCRVVFLDDGYSKHHIKKLDLVIEIDTPNSFCLPAGPYRERLWKEKEALMLKEGRDFRRKTDIKDARSKMVLVTAIARPERLDRYLPDLLGKYYFADHHFFEKDELESILRRSGAESLLVTFKDYVKIREFGLPLSLLDLELQVAGELYEKVDKYIKNEEI